jgi:hypothetical protein
MCGGQEGIDRHLHGDESKAECSTGDEEVERMVDGLLAKLEENAIKRGGASMDHR